MLDLTDRVQALEAAIAKHGLAIQDHEKRLQTVGSHPSPQTTLAEGAEQRRCLFGEGRSRNEDLGQTPVSIASADHHEPPSEGRVTDGMAISFVSEADTGHFGKFELAHVRSTLGPHVLHLPSSVGLITQGLRLTIL